MRISVLPLISLGISTPVKPIIRDDWDARYLDDLRPSEVQPAQLIVRGHSAVHPFSLS